MLNVSFVGNVDDYRLYIGNINYYFAPSYRDATSTPYRVNKTINEQFKEFCKEHKEFTAKDLLSQALKEFMDKYSK